MKYLITKLICILSLFLISCSKEKTGNTKTIFKNSTDHRIKIIPYIGNLVDNANIKTLLQQSETVVYEANVRGKTIDPSFGLLLQPYDSVVVSYDDTVKIPHIKFNLVYTGTHRILFSSSRSISNEANYTKTITDETKNSLTGYYLYEFKEQDYLDAKK
jgi:hypothetical protein